MKKLKLLLVLGLGLIFINCEKNYEPVSLCVTELYITPESYIPPGTEPQENWILVSSNTIYNNFNSYSKSEIMYTEEGINYYRINTCNVIN